MALPGELFADAAAVTADAAVDADADADAAADAAAAVVVGEVLRDGLLQCLALAYMFITSPSLSSAIAFATQLQPRHVLGQPRPLLHQPDGLRLPHPGRERRVSLGTPALLPAHVHDLGFPAEARRRLRAIVGFLRKRRCSRAGEVEGCWVQVTVFGFWRRAGCHAWRKTARGLFGVLGLSLFSFTLTSVAHGQHMPR